MWCVCCHVQDMFTALSQPCVGHVHGCARGMFTDTCMAYSPPHVACSPRSQLCACHGAAAAQPWCREGHRRGGGAGVTQPRRLPPHLALQLPAGTGSSEDTAREAAACAGAAAATEAYRDLPLLPQGLDSPHWDPAAPQGAAGPPSPTPSSLDATVDSCSRAGGLWVRGDSWGSPMAAAVAAYWARCWRRCLGEGRDRSSCGAGSSQWGHPAPPPPHPVAAAERGRGCPVPPTPCLVGQRWGEGAFLTPLLLLAGPVPPLPAPLSVEPRGRAGSWAPLPIPRLQDPAAAPVIHPRSLKSQVSLIELTSSHQAGSIQCWNGLIT